MINYTELEQQLKLMKPRQRLFELVKKELKSRGHWKALKRGKPHPESLNKK